MKTMANEELLPCPFCGGKAKAYTWNTGCAVSCEDCGGSYECQKPPTYINRAIQNWNKRVNVEKAGE